MSAILNPFHLLELHIISAQDLSRVSRSMRTYAVTWIHPDRKLSTRVDSHGKSDPSWNDRFLFKVDDGFILSDTSSITIEIYSVHWLKDILVGTVRVIVGNLLPPPGSSHRSRRRQNVGMQLAALQVRRPSGRPQGILTVGVVLLDSSRKSMPLCSEISVPLTGTTIDNAERSLSIVHGNNHAKKLSNRLDMDGGGAVVQPVLTRSKSETSLMEVGADGIKLKRKVSFRERLNSIISVSEGSSSQDPKLHKGASSTPASMVNGYYVSHPNENANPDKAWKSGNDSVLSGSSVGKGSSAVKIMELDEGMMLVDLRDSPNGMKPFNSRKMITKSGLGLSGSKVVVSGGARGKVPYRAVVPSPNNVVALEGSIVTISESMEGLQSKMERWRMEVPVIYDMSEISSYTSSAMTRTSVSRGTKHGRRRADGEGQSGLFSCFSNICGCECSIVCGRGSAEDTSPRQSRSRRRRRHSHSPTSHTYTMSL